MNDTMFGTFEEAVSARTAVMELIKTSVSVVNSRPLNAIQNSENRYGLIHDSVSQVETSP